LTKVFGLSVMCHLDPALRKWKTGILWWRWGSSILHIALRFPWSQPQWQKTKIRSPWNWWGNLESAWHSMLDNQTDGSVHHITALIIWCVWEHVDIPFRSFLSRSSWDSVFFYVCSKCLIDKFLSLWHMWREYECAQIFLEDLGKNHAFWGKHNKW